MDKGHSERLVPMIAEVMAEAGVAFSGLSRLAVTLGPGSFTGVRTGISVARAMALATGAAVTGTTSLHVMALQALTRQPNRTIAIAMQTRGGLLYFQIFEAGTAVPRQPAWLATAEQAAAALGTAGAIVAGSGAALVAVAAQHHGVTCDIAQDLKHPEASYLSRIAENLPKLLPPQPIYLREADALPQSGMALTRTPV